MWHLGWASLVLVLGFVFVPFLRVLGEHMVDGVGERGEFSLIDQLELFDEVYKVLETRIEMRLGVELHDLLDVVVVHMPVHSEQPLQDRLHDLGTHREGRECIRISERM